MKALLCSPDYFGVSYEINPWMHVQTQPDSALAMTQWRALCEALQGLGVTLELIAPVKGQPDMVFTANGGLVKGLEGAAQVVLPNFRHPERQGERSAFAAWFEAQGYQTQSLPANYPFEGEGDALFCGQRLFTGYPVRTHLGAHRQLGEIFDCEVISLMLVNPAFYHLDTCFFPINPELAVYYPKAFDDHGIKLIKTYFKETIALSDTDAVAFCCNGLAVGQNLILPQGSEELKGQLEALGFKVTYLNFSEFIKAGGAAKCLTLWLE